MKLNFFSRSRADNFVIFKQTFFFNGGYARPCCALCFYQINGYQEIRLKRKWKIPKTVQITIQKIVVI